MEIFSYDIYNLLTHKIDSIETLQNYCRINKNIYKMCKDNRNSISKHLLEVYQVDYTDSSNFIYIYNKVNMIDYKDIDNKWKYQSLLKLYMKHYNQHEIKCRGNELLHF